jgi:hypothetical protein
MGQLFSQGGLTNQNTALLDPQTQQPTFVGSPSQVLSKANANLPQASAGAILGGDVFNPNAQGPKLPLIGTPSFQQAATAGAMPGGVNTLSPGLNKAGKLVTLIKGGLEGALAGRAAQEQMIAASGGHRAGGIGVGFEGGYTLPFLRAQQQQAVTRGGLENQILGAQAQNAGLLQRLGIMKTQAEINKDRYVTPRSGGVYDIQGGQFAPGTEPQDKSQNIDNLIAAAAARAQSQGRDPSQDPDVKQLSDIKTSLQKDPQPKTQNDFEQYYSSWLKDSGQPDTAANRLAAHKQWEIKPLQPGAGDARLDRSYQFNSTQLEKLGQPIDEAVRRMGRLQDTLNQNTPQADALVAPELLTVMAGGQGSGLRMNEAEIARIVGGRSNWESLQAAANKWRLDPSTANSITPAQRQQIRALVSTVQQRLSAKQSALDEAHEALINATDPVGHRRVVAAARSKMTAVDQGGGGAALPAGNGQLLDKATAQQFFSAAGGDKDKARQLAQQNGWKVQ